MLITTATYIQSVCYKMKRRYSFTPISMKRSRNASRPHCACVVSMRRMPTSLIADVQIVLGASSLPQRHPAQRLHLNRDRFVRLGLPLLRVGPDDPLVEQRV